MPPRRAARAPVWPIPAFAPRPLAEDAYDVVVVGAGIGGLAAAALLTKRGAKVLVLEAHHMPGGNCASWRRRVEIDGVAQSFVFDSGVQDISGLGPKGPLTHLLRELGAEDRLDWRRVTHLYWRDGVRVEGSDTVDAFAANLARAFPAEAAGLRAFFAEMAAVYADMYADVEATGGVPMPPSPVELIGWPEAHPGAFKWLKRPFFEMLSAFLRDETLKRLLTTVSEYVTDRPAALTVADMAPLYGYYFVGGRYPAGGVGLLGETLARSVRENGGRVAVNARVERISMEDGRAAGVRLAGGREFRTRIVIANGDVVRTLTELSDPALLPADYAARLVAMGRGPSAVLVGLGLARLPNLPARIFVSRGGLEFGIGNPSAIDATLAPKGMAAMTLLHVMPAEDAAPFLVKDETYGARKAAFAERLIDAVAASVFPDIRKYIVYREIATAATFSAVTGAVGGHIYGAALGGWRPGLRSPVPGLFLVGAGTETGAGIEAVVVSATRAANLIGE
jgi:all-trans-retinol 13,14-reductase